MDLAPKYRMLLLLVIALVVTWVAFLPLINIARRNSLLDRPGQRKLQRNPVPVLGGAAVFLGIVVGLCYFKTMLSYTSLFSVLGAMVVMLYVGMMDDMLSIKPIIRLVVEAVVAMLLIYGTHYSICNFQGIWGIDHLPTWLSVPLSVFAMVGIINAINMIDGVDGLSSGYCIMACALFGVMFFIGHDYSFAALAMVTIGALIPFFLHNVFGHRSKMFIGDGGTMLMGTILSSMVLSFCRYTTYYHEFVTYNFAMIPFCLAVLALPVFDTLRVMTARILRGTSPFKADKTHLHHFFIDAGFSHLGVTLIEICLDLLVVAAWTVCWISGYSPEIQLYVVLAAAVVFILLPSLFLGWHSGHNTKLFRRLRAAGSYTHLENSRFWTSLQERLDRKETSQDAEENLD